MRTIGCLLSPPARIRAAAAGRRILFTAIAAGVSALTLIAAPPAGAVVRSEGGMTVGLQPRELTSVFDGNAVSGEFRDEQGGPILPATVTYVVYWDPKNAYYGEWQHSINEFMAELGDSSGTLGSVFAVDSQYTDPAGQHARDQIYYRGAYTDTNPYPTVGNCTDPAPLHGGKAITCVTGEQVQEQLNTFIQQHKLPTGMEPSVTKGVPAVYYVLTPPGVTVCLEAGHCSDYPATPEEIEKDEETGDHTGAYEDYENSFCSYHAAFNPDNAKDGDEKTVIYAVIPWVAGGKGDYHLASEDRKAAYDCQDGAFWLNPETKDIEKEHPKPNKTEKEQRLAAETKEKEELKKAEEDEAAGTITETELAEKRAGLAELRAEREAAEAKAVEEREFKEGPREQEPNQQGLSEDGSYDFGLADLIVSQIGAEQQNIVTDPLLNGWQDESHKESTDECRNFFLFYEGGSGEAEELTDAGTLFNQTLGEHRAYINDAFDLAARKSDYPGVPCLTGVSLAPAFTVPTSPEGPKGKIDVKVGELVGFDGMESTITLDAGVKFNANDEEETVYPTFKWNFGDGSPEVTGQAPGAPSLNSPETSPCAAPWEAPCAASTFHAFSHPGNYTVTLTVTDVAGNEAEVTRKITVLEAPKLTQQPKNDTVYESQTASFEAVATGWPTPEVQWEVSSDAGATWSEIAGATHDTLSIAGAKMSESGDEYRAKFTNVAGTTTTEAATLTVEQEAPRVNVQPQSPTLYEGESATIEAQASGWAAPTVQWEHSSDGGAAWSEIEGATSNTLQLTSVKYSESGEEYRARFNNAAGAATSNPATLTVALKKAEPQTPGSKKEEAPGTSKALESPFPPPPPPPAPPVAAVAIASHQSLSHVLSKGLVVDYSVNEQVAGHVEVLLNAALAHRLGIGGTPVNGLPSGMPAEVEIAKALVVTTRSGHDTLHIDFSKRTVARLRRVRQVSLLLRLVVHGGKSPLTSTVLKTATLKQ